MSLDYDLTMIKNREEVTTITLEDGSKIMNPTTTNIIFGCLSTYIGDITEANYIEWMTRYHIWNMTHGHKDYFTLEDVKAHIGLHTNVWPKKPMTKWFKEHIWDGALYDVKNRPTMNLVNLENKKNA